MPELQLKFMKAGMQTLVQDLGRSGHQQQGVPISGVLDRQSAKAANEIVGNSVDTPVIEITVIGPEIHFDQSCKIAITGANISPRLNNEPIANHRLQNVRAGSILSFGKMISGCRAYLAVAGKWNVNKWLGSASASTISPELLTPDSVITKGSTISITTNDQSIHSTTSIHQTVFTNIVRLRVIPGPEFEWFTKVAIARFFSTGHIISQAANRMGYQIKTSGMEHQKEMISSGIIPGTIQITPDGRAIVLLADAQTTGGYPRIANIIDDDLDKMAQMKPGGEVWFSLA
ncbi:biotin-dependent carboxyltransferase family protein [Marivirga sp. S37H4]|uniref:Biotin-dependent carboxyltransferase family protein n=1 Tax=Marivirga aurantiaca TaxID=2802615 RepID=A0A935CA91_9BACT|nr:biotin-dependent carboxyltransferase family protein [Marivirga aurantiaca]MBK6266409.1 biotin-dependent carboxyltransferase family protein [Marivirga aurantiaca]